MADTTIDFSHLTPAQRLELIAAWWDSLAQDDAAHLSPDLARELDRRVTEMDRESGAERPWTDILADLRKRLG